VFKSLQFLLIAFIILISTNILTFGIAGFFGFAFTNISFTIPIILLAICIADTVHMMSTLCTSYHDDTQLKQALYATYFKNLKPTIITSLTTAIGFFSLVSSNTAPIMEMGLVSGLGVLLAWLSTYVLFGPLILLMPTIKFKNTNIISAKVWEKLSQWIIKMRWPITIIFTLLTIASFLLAMQNKMDLNPIDQFASSSKIWKTNQFIQNKIGGLQGPELLIDSGEKDGIKNPLFLQKIELLTQKILQYPFVNKVKSINDFLKQINQTLHNDQKEFYSLPKTQNAVAEALLLLTMDSHQADIINSKVSIDRRYLRLSVLWNIDSSQEGLLATEDIVNKAQSLGLNTYATGKNNLSVNMVNYIFDTFVSSIALSLIFITLVIIISLKSIKIGLFSIIPNILPIILGGAWIYLSGNLLDFSCVVAFVISLGIAVDDTVHFLVAHKDYKNEKNSLILIFKKSGNGIVLTTFILVLGFISLTFSDFLANYKLGFLTVVVLGSALIADLFFLPALISILSKKKPN
jgi:predicted RND superfamily exporter protein